MMRRRQTQQGFTLIELMVVIVIIGILVAIALPNFIGATDRAKIASLKSNGHTLQIAVETYSVDFGGIYPGSHVAILSSGGYKAFANPYTGATNVAAVGDGSWSTNDDGQASDPNDQLINFVKPSIPGHAVYVGMDSAGDATTDPSGTDSGTLTVNYHIFLTDKTGHAIPRYLLTPGTPTPSGQLLLGG